MKARNVPKYIWALWMAAILVMLTTPLWANTNHERVEYSENK